MEYDTYGRAPPVAVTGWKIDTGTVLVNFVTVGDAYVGIVLTLNAGGLTTKLNVPVLTCLA